MTKTRVRLPKFLRHALRCRQEEGQDIIEFAIVLPFLLLLTFAIVEGGLLLSNYNTVANAAREGARAGIVAVDSSSCDKNCVRDKAKLAVKTLMAGLDTAYLKDPPDVTVTDTSVSVTVTYNYPSPILKGFGGPASIQLTATSVMQRE